MRFLCVPVGQIFGVRTGHRTGLAMRRRSGGGRASSDDNIRAQMSLRNRTILSSMFSVQLLRKASVGTTEQQCGLKHANCSWGSSIVQIKGTDPKQNEAVRKRENFAVICAQLRVFEEPSKTASAPPLQFRLEKGHETICRHLRSAACPRRAKLSSFSAT